MKTTSSFIRFTIFAGILSVGSGALAQSTLAFAPLLSTEKELAEQSKQNLSFCMSSNVQYKRTISVGGDPALDGQVLGYSAIEASDGNKSVSCFYEPVEIDSVSSDIRNGSGALNVVAKANRWLYIPYLGTGLDRAVRKKFDEQFDALIRKSSKKVAIKNFEDFNLYKVSAEVSSGNQASTVSTAQYLYTFPHCEISKSDSRANGGRIQLFDQELKADISYPQILSTKLRKYLAVANNQNESQVLELNKMVQELKVKKAESNIGSACDISFQQNFNLELARQAELVRQLQIDDANNISGSHESLTKAETEQVRMLQLILDWN